MESIHKSADIIAQNDGEDPFVDDIRDFRKGKEDEKATLEKERDGLESAPQDEKSGKGDKNKAKIDELKGKITEINDLLTNEDIFWAAMEKSMTDGELSGGASNGKTRKELRLIAVSRVGGKWKNNSQIAGIKNAYIAADAIQIGFSNKIPLWLFGFLY